MSINLNDVSATGERPIIVKKRTQDSNSSTVKASAEIGASAKYEVKKKVIIRVPDDVVRAKNDAWLTMLSPFTGWAGLIGDKLAHKRDMLRIQQEEALTAILARAAPRLVSIRTPVKPIPLKLLVPFLENASLEDPRDGNLIEMWANLLVSSAENYSADNVYYVRLMSQISSVQARLFESIIGPRGPHSVLVSMEQNYFLGSQFIQERIAEGLVKSKRPLSTLTQVWRCLVKTLNMQGVVIEHIDVGHVNEQDNYTSGSPKYSVYADENQNDFAILRGLGLLEYIDTGYFDAAEIWRIKVLAHYVSPLGLRFGEACGVQAKKSV